MGSSRLASGSGQKRPPQDLLTWRISHHDTYKYVSSKPLPPSSSPLYAPKSILPILFLRLKYYSPPLASSLLPLSIRFNPENSHEFVTNGTKHVTFWSW